MYVTEELIIVLHYTTRHHIVVPGLLHGAGASTRRYRCYSILCTVVQPPMVVPALHVTLYFIPILYAGAATGVRSRAGSGSSTRQWRRVIRRRPITSASFSASSALRSKCRGPSPSRAWWRKTVTALGRAPNSMSCMHVQHIHLRRPAANHMRYTIYYIRV